MNIPNRVIIRIYFKTPTSPYIKFYWFEMNGEDLYWGPSKKYRSWTKIVSTNDKGELPITIPDNFQDFPETTIKHSYHSSGQTHSKTVSPDGKELYDSPNYWKLKDSIDKPHLFFAMVTPVLETIKSYTPQPKVRANKHEYAINIHLPNDLSINERFYMEFYLSPEGTYEFPKSFLGIQELPYMFTHSLSQKLILIGKLIRCPAIEKLQPNVGFSFILNDDMASSA